MSFLRLWVHANYMNDEIHSIFPCIATNKMLLSVSVDVKQATIVQVKFQKWLAKMKVIGRNEIRSTLCQKCATEPGEEY